MFSKLLDRKPANTCGSLNHVREGLPKCKDCSRKKKGRIGSYYCEIHVL